MAVQFFEEILSSWFGFTGDYTYIALGLLIFFLVVLLFVGLDFKFAVILTAPLGVAFTTGGWLTTWVSIVYWILVLGMGIYTVWLFISEK